MTFCTYNVTFGKVHRILFSLSILQQSLLWTPCQEITKICIFVPVQISKNSRTKRFRLIYIFKGLKGKVDLNDFPKLISDCLSIVILDSDQVFLVYAGAMCYLLHKLPFSLSPLSFLSSIVHRCRNELEQKLFDGLFFCCCLL